MSTPEIDIRPATRSDVPLIFSFIRELAEYERLSQDVVSSEERVAQTLFGPKPAAEALIATVDQQPAGFAVYFQNYSTFAGRPGIYLEDLFVRPALRGKGIGRRLLARLATIARDRGCARLEWVVLDWNEPAIRFYETLGAKPLDGWRVFSLSGKAMDDLAG
ncbi:MAG TPA: GNAT family N-acetyltransferase [Phycisphaerae bacterium]|nr:GNAT family N-acetyltransferase [Phycisphaerae bacterium]